MDMKKAYRCKSHKNHPDEVYKHFPNLLGLIDMSAPTNFCSFFGWQEKFKLVIEADAVLLDLCHHVQYNLGEDEDSMTDSSHI
jgi:hypothetical protein